MWRWFLSFGVLLAAIVAGVAASWKEQWIEESIYWLTEVRGYVITEARERARFASKAIAPFRGCTPHWGMPSRYYRRALDCPGQVISIGSAGLDVILRFAQWW